MIELIAIYYMIWIASFTIMTVIKEDKPIDWNLKIKLIVMPILITLWLPLFFILLITD
jgi:hypothetical protein